MQVIVILDSQIRRLRPRGQGRGFRYKAWFRQQGGHAGLAQWSLLGDAQPQLSLCLLRHLRIAGVERRCLFLALDPSRLYCCVILTKILNLSKPQL